MDEKEAIVQFQELLRGVKADDRKNFLNWIKNSIIAGDLDIHKFSQLQTTYSPNIRQPYKLEPDQTCRKSNCDVILDSIREDIRISLPLNATSQTEVIQCPEIGTNADCDPRTTIHIDAFLYDEDVVDELCDEGKLSRNYCVNCGSRNIKPLTFITHSASVEQIKYIFQYLLPDLRNKTVLDVGSRTGAILYGAYLFSEAKMIYGVEIDATFCQLQEKVIEKYNMKDRVQVIHSDILLCEELLRNCDVVILNNVFEFFMPSETQIQIWKFLSQVLRRKDLILITSPSIEESLSNLQTFINVPGWLTQVDIDAVKQAAVTSLFSSQEDSDLDDIHMYTVNAQINVP